MIHIWKEMHLLLPGSNYVKNHPTQLSLPILVERQTKKLVHNMSMVNERNWLLCMHFLSYK